MVRLDFIMRILFDYYYDKYLGAFRFVSVGRNNRTIKSLLVCAEAMRIVGMNDQRILLLYNFDAESA